MKILYIDQPLEPPGGGQVSLLLLLKNLDKDKINFVVFIPYQCSFFEELKKEGIDVKIVPLGKLYKSIKNYSPDVIHCNSATTKYTFVAALTAKILKIPFVWHNRTLETAGWKEKIIANLATKIIAISDAVNEKFKDFKEKVVKVYNAVDNEVYKPNLDVEYLYKELNLSKNDKIIGIFSRLDWWKGHKLAIDAFKVVYTKINNVKLLIVGEGPYKNDIVEYTKKVGIYENVLFLGYRKDIPQLMNLCYVILNPSTQPEPFGRTIIEAMSCGKVVISTNLGGPTEIINHLEDGILVSPNKEEINKYMKLVFKDKELYNKISTNALLKAKKFAIENHINKILEVYQEVIS